MNGIVDEQSRALVKIQVAKSIVGERVEVEAWVDTAFNGSLVIPHRLVAALGLSQESAAEARLAVGNLVQLETFACFFDWFGETYQTQVIANDGTYALLGTMLLEQHRLVVDYNDRTVELL